MSQWAEAINDKEFAEPGGICKNSTAQGKLLTHAGAA
jgi:hypothetical protein